MEIRFIGFEGKPIELLRKPFEDLIGKLAQGLELKSLKYIIIPEDFKTELFKFQKSKGLREECTENEVGVAGGKVVSYIEAGELEICIFLHPGVFGLLFSKNSDDVLNGIQIMRHELCHVHDDYLKSRVLSLDFITNQERDFEWALKLHADSIWSEYIANKLSKTTVNINGTEINLPNQISLMQDLKLFLDSIFKVESDAQKYIDAYRSHADVEKLYQEIQESASFLLNMMGRVYGMLCPYEELIKAVDDGIKETYAFDIWKQLCQSLDALSSKYPNWSGVQEFDGLSQVVLKTWNILGIYPRVTESGLYIEVPAPMTITNAPLKAYIESLAKIQEPISRIMEQYNNAMKNLVPQMIKLEPSKRIIDSLEPYLRANEELQANIESFGNVPNFLKEYRESEKAMGETAREVLNDMIATKQEEYNDRKKIIELLDCICTNVKDINRFVKSIDSTVKDIKTKVK